MHNEVPRDLNPAHAPSVFDIDVLAIARIYAAALLQAARKADKIDLMQQHFDALFGRSAPQSDDPSLLQNLLRGEAIPKGRRAQVFKKALENRVDPMFLDFLLVLNDHDRLDIARAVGSMYRQLRDVVYRRVRIIVRSAVPLDDSQREHLKDLAKTFTGKDPILVEEVKPDLIGGLQLQVGDQLIDVSVRSRIESLRNQLIARCNYEIQCRRDRLGSAAGD